VAEAAGPGSPFSPFGPTAPSGPQPANATATPKKTNAIQRDIISPFQKSKHAVFSMKEGARDDVPSYQAHRSRRESEQAVSST
jgi:hypothetical protein